MNEKVKLVIELSKETVMAAMFMLDEKLKEGEWESLTAKPISLDLKELGLDGAETKQMEMGLALIATGKVLNR